VVMCKTVIFPTSPPGSLPRGTGLASWRKPPLGQRLQGSGCGGENQW
jgi:hypothetical protein